MAQPQEKLDYKPIDAAEINSMNIYKDISPSVVKIDVRSTSVVKDETGKVHKIPSGGSGSGSIIDKQGHVITNFHVIDAGEEIKVILNKDNVFKAKVIGADPHTDVALLKIIAPKSELAKLPVMKIGGSQDLKGGQRVYAIGNPFQLFRTMTQGIVSATDRSIISPGRRLTKGIVQTDASINPGNSAGALINARGQQVGVNAQIYSRVGQSAGIVFAIPMETVMNVVEDLKTKGRVDRPYLGMSGGIPLEMMPPQFIKMLGLEPEQTGIIIQDIIPESPAEKAGLAPAKIPVQISDGRSANVIKIGGDIVTKVDNKPVSNMTEFFEILDSKEIGDKLDIEVINIDVEPLEDGQVNFIAMDPEIKTLIIEQTPAPKKNKGALSLKDLDIENNNNKPKPLEDDDMDLHNYRSF